ncbi:hypothetical protein NE619_08760 [Anaerovorax odorimutans]|uniref:Uncharacterized protein n=1 Tax=Anaerovorax odorimutans TaxID=109327 RepID=A0ABT1RPL1_9FIRM|nr:hypothetical protein [Anaerovorax odorimutans]MCQ4636821.1 hypothetical protein [Anaerovorax odorimutans]
MKKIKEKLPLLLQNGAIGRGSCFQRQGRPLFRKVDISMEK